MHSNLPTQSKDILEAQTTEAIIWACGLFVLAIAVRIAVALVVYGRETSDTHFFRVLADTILAGQSPYSLPWQYANYPPLWTYFIPSGVRAWSNLLGWPMDFGIKLMPIFLDGCMSALIFIWLRNQGIATWAAVGWSLLLALNPLAIDNNAVQGQIDSLPIGIALIGALIFLRRDYRWQILGALTLGLSLSFKTYPLMFLPFFLWEIVRRYGWQWRKLLTIVALVFMPLILQEVPLIWLGQSEGLNRTLTYMFLQSGAGGIGQFGPLAIVKWLGIPVAQLTVDVVKVPTSWGVLGQALVYIMDKYRLLLLSKALFGGAYLLVCVIGRKPDLPLSMLITLLLVFVFIGGYFGYYFMWLIPFAALTRQRFAIYYSLVGLALLVTENGSINLLFWGVCTCWLLYLIIPIAKGFDWSMMHPDRLTETAHQWWSPLKIDRVRTD